MAEAETAPSLEARNEPKGLGKIPLGSLTELNKKRGILLELRGAGNLGSATDKPPAMRQQARGRLLRAGGFQRPAPAREAWRSGLPDVASRRGARPRLQRHPSSSHADGWPPKGRVMRRCRYAHLHPLDADAPPPQPPPLPHPLHRPRRSPTREANSRWLGRRFFFPFNFLYRV